MSLSLFSRSHNKLSLSLAEQAVSVSRRTSCLFCLFCFVCFLFESLSFSPLTFLLLPAQRSRTTNCLVRPSSVFSLLCSAPFFAVTWNCTKELFEMACFWIWLVLSKNSVSFGDILWNTTFWMDDLPLLRSKTETAVLLAVVWETKQRQRQTDKQTDRQTETESRQTNRSTEQAQQAKKRDIDRERCRDTDTDTDRNTDTDRETETNTPNTQTHNDLPSQTHQQDARIVWLGARKCHLRCVQAIAVSEK